MSHVQNLSIKDEEREREREREREGVMLVRRGKKEKQTLL